MKKIIRIECVEVVKISHMFEIVVDESIGEYELDDVTQKEYRTAEDLKKKMEEELKGKADEVIISGVTKQFLDKVEYEDVTDLYPKEERDAQS